MEIALILQHGFGFVLTALCWGFTNPFIKRGSTGIEVVKHRKWLHQTMAECYFLFTNWRYMLPLVINLSGSAVYYYTLHDADITIAVPITNSLALVFTILAGMLVGERRPTSKEILGMLCIVFGVALCVTS